MMGSWRNRGNSSNITDIFKMTTITETLDCQVKQRSKERTEISNFNNNKRETEILVDFYDASLPLNDPKYLKPIRAWEKRVGFVTPLIWTNIILLAVIHIVTLVWGVQNIYVGKRAKWQTIAALFVFGYMGGFGVTGGAHRYWTHRSFKAKLPLKLFLMICYSVAAQYNIIYWVRDHRVHHKFSETTADPHDANRGFFFAHVGWFMMKRHPNVLKEGKKLDMTDLTNDPLIRFYVKHHGLLCAICFIISTVIPVVAWNENWTTSIITNLFRCLILLHSTWSVNSFAHLWGNHPYDKHIMPAENPWVSYFAMGEGWHNYHHTFPWDYKAAELPYTLNPTTLFIDVFAKLGLAYDLKKASPSLIKTVLRNRGEH